MKKLYATKEKGFTLQNFPKKVSGGFTIVETLIALTIFSIAVAGIITVAVQGGTNVNATRNRLVANYLVQEGIELVRGYRDSKVLASPGNLNLGWGTFIADVTSSCSVRCDIDSLAPGTLLTCPGGVCPALNYDSSTVSTTAGYYNHLALSSTNMVTPFTRSLTITVPTGSTEAIVTATVTWTDGSLVRSTMLSESLFSWYPEE